MLSPVYTQMFIWKDINIVEEKKFQYGKYIQIQQYSKGEFCGGMHLTLQLGCWLRYLCALLENLGFMSGFDYSFFWCSLGEAVAMLKSMSSCYSS